MSAYRQRALGVSRRETPSLTRGPSESYLGALGAVLIGALVTAAPVMFHLASQPLAIALCVLLSVILTCVMAASVPVALVIAYLFQNLFVALVSPHIDGAEQLNTLRAYNFLMTATVWLVVTVGYWLDRGSLDRRARIVIDATTAALVLIGLYFVLGIGANAESAVTYLRNIAAPFLLLQICLLIAHRSPVEFMKPLVIVAAIATAYGFLELFAQKQLLALVNGDVYVGLRVRQEYEGGVWLRQLEQTGYVMRSYLDSLTIDFLNTPLLPDTNIKLYRLLGPNFHSISFAYALAILAMILVASGRWWWSLLVLPLLLVIGSKGALVALFLVLIFQFFVAKLGIFRSIVWYLGAITTYAVAGIIVGIRASDYHVIGFLGGVRGFLANPLGRGIGAGGNLSLSVSAYDWSKSQALGHTDMALESAVGVLLYQMGIAGLAILGILSWIAFILWRQFRMTGDRMLLVAALGILAVMVNGIFQEEALFAPLALGLMCAFAGIMLGSTYRHSPSRVRVRTTLRPAAAN